MFSVCGVVLSNPARTWHTYVCVVFPSYCTKTAPGYRPKQLDLTSQLLGSYTRYHWWDRCIGGKWNFKDRCSSWDADSSRTSLEIPRILWNQTHYRVRQNVKVKRTLVQALKLCTDRTAHRGSRGIALPFHDHGTRRGEGSASRPGRSLPSRKTRYPLYRSWVGTRAGLDRCRKSRPTGIRSLDRPARSQSLHRVTQPTHTHTHTHTYIYIYIYIKHIYT